MFLSLAVIRLSGIIPYCKKLEAEIKQKEKKEWKIEN